VLRSRDNIILRIRRQGGKERRVARHTHHQIPVLVRVRLRDLLLNRAYQTYIDELKQYHNPRYGRGPIGGNYYAGTSSISANVPFGAATMATPDGRKATTPLAEGASPASGTERFGPTAVINSVGKLPVGSILGGVLLNQKLNPATLENDGDRHKLMLLLRTFFEVRKGWHIQYNIVSRETLLAAKAHPDQYRDLVVRVAGKKEMSW